MRGGQSGRRWRTRLLGVLVASMGGMTLVSCSSQGASAPTTLPIVTGLGLPIQGAESSFPSSASWAQDGSTLTGSSDVPGLAQVILSGDPSNVSHFIVTAVLGNNLTQGEVNEAVLYLHDAGNLAADQQGSDWVGTQLSAVTASGSFQPTSGSTTIETDAGKVTLSFASSFILNQPTIVLTAKL